MDQEVTVYSLPVCPNCNLLNELLKRWGVTHKEESLDTPAARTKLLMHAVFTAVAPVLQVGEKFYTYDTLFPNNTLDERKVAELVSK